MNNSLALTCLLLALGNTGLARAETAPTQSAAPPDSTSASRGARAPVELKHGTWSNGVKESDHRFTCPDDEVLVGRAHDGDENGKTFYKCATATQNGAPIKFIDTTSYGPYKESEKDGHLYTCPKNTAMVGRSHYSDENGNTWYRCAQPISTYWNDDPMQVTLGHWSESMKERGSSYTCELPMVLMGRHHRGDENGTTQYQCGLLW